MFRHATIRSWIRFSAFIFCHALLATLACAGSSQPLTQPFLFKASDAPIPNAEAPTFDAGGWTKVTLPHTWAKPDGKPTHSNAWYRTTFSLDAKVDAGQRIYLRFAGVATVADIYVNGKHLGQHRGAYTAFIIDATDAVKLDGENLLAIKVSNDPKETADCLPSGAALQLYKVYGGIYRGVEIIKKPAIHIYPDLASSGVFVTTESADSKEAKIMIRAVVRNASDTDHEVLVACDIDGPLGAAGASLSAAVTKVPAKSTKEFTLHHTLAQPKLWAPGSPALYTLKTKVLRVDTDKKIIAAEEEAVVTFGIRTIKYENGQFILNGQPFYVRGVNKHQETEYKLTAVGPEDLATDWQNLQDMGVNTVRLAHYPHVALEYDEADRRGIAVWAENGHSNNAKPSSTGELITREMVRQNYNHPSILFWSCGNEAENVASSRYAEIIREEDPSRLVTYASNGQTPTHLDFMARNVYPGWYGGYYRSFNNKYTSEVGAGGSIATHCSYDSATWKVDRFEPEEYQQIFAEQKMMTIFRNPPQDHPMFLWWTFREFGDAKFKGRNSKGILTYANHKKSIYYLFQSFLRPETPVVHIASRTWLVRTTADEAGIKVYSNAPKLTLKVNGVERGVLANGAYEQPLLKPPAPTTKKGSETKPAATEPTPSTRLKVDNVFFWPTPNLRPGNNLIEVADGAGHTDRVTVYYAGPSALPAEEVRAPLGLLKSSNPGNPAYYHAEPVHSQWPVYYECDGTADNTFDVLPAVLEGATRVVTKRLSKPENKTEITFTAAAGVTVYVVVTDDEGSAGLIKALMDAGFTLTGAKFQMRNNALALAPAWLLERKVGAKAVGVTIPAATSDYAVLVKPTP